MRNCVFARADRRRFLYFGATAAAAAVFGCDGSGGQVETVTTPPATGGNRSRLESRAAKGAAAKSGAGKSK
jgi:hypothetical protein